MLNAELPFAHAQPQSRRKSKEIMTIAKKHLKTINREMLNLELTLSPMERNSIKSRINYLSWHVQDLKISILWSVDSRKEEMLSQSLETAPMMLLLSKRLMLALRWELQELK